MIFLKETTVERAKKGEEGMMARADESERRRTWQEDEAQRECLVATAADVVYVSSDNIALPTPKRMGTVALS